MARMRIEEHRVKLAPGEAPSIELYVGRRHSGTRHLAAQPPAERTRRDPETGFVDLHFDAMDFERVQALLDRAQPVFVGEQLGLEA